MKRLNGTWNLQRLLDLQQRGGEPSHGRESHFGSKNHPSALAVSLPFVFSQPTFY